jgi:GNAT superfamily N-acetyltransferase
VIRRALPGDLPHLRELERAAGAAFADIGMTAVALDDPPPLEVLAGYQRNGRAWVATGRLDGDDREVPVAYLLVDVVDGAAHVEQVSVHPAHARRRLGSALLETAAAWAAENRLEAVTLTTFTEVPWNAPYYARLGFRVVPADEIGEGLRQIRQHEAAAGLDRWPRVVMRRRVLGT